MGKYIGKRLLYMILVLLGVAFLVFAILSLTPGDPGTIILGVTASPDDIAALNHEFGYDQPFLIRFFEYIKGIVCHLDERICDRRYLTWCDLCCTEIFGTGSFLCDHSTGLCLYPWFLARTDADYGICPELTYSAVFRRG